MRVQRLVTCVACTAFNGCNDLHDFIDIGDLIDLDSQQKVFIEVAIASYGLECSIALATLFHAPARIDASGQLFMKVRASTVAITLQRLM